MGRIAKIDVVGPYSPDIASILRDVRGNPPEGTTVIAGLTECNTSEGSREFAEALGIELKDYTKYVFSKQTNPEWDWERIAEALIEKEVYNQMDFNPVFIQESEALWDKGFTFFFRWE